MNYKGKDPMSPEKITSHEPTAVSSTYLNVHCRILVDQI